ncbi:hypothetical protein BG842_03835 [Haladaptatus sp. W1]|nr:hypothetical protein BG842_03835 [Haladaptatus sp. W1]
MYNTAKILSKRHTVDLVVVNEDEEQPEHIQALQNQFNDVVSFNYPKSRFYLNTVSGLVSEKPLQSFYYHFDRVQEWVDDHSATYDMVYCNHVRTAEYARDLDVPVVVDFVDAISRNYAEAKDGASGVWKWLYSIDSDRLLEYERTLIEEVDRSFIISAEDREYITEDVALDDTPVVVPNGVREKLLDSAKAKRTDANDDESQSIVFLGKMDYFPNEDAATFFANKVFPKIRKQCPDAVFEIVGMNPTEEVQSLGERSGIRVTGFVEEPMEYLNQASVVVAPMRFGAGVQNKILEAMALSKPVITTSLGLEGIDATDSVDIKVADDPGGLAEKTVELLNNRQQRTAIGNEARRCIVENYRWDVVERTLLEEIDEVLAEADPSSGVRERAIPQYA